MSGSCLQVSEDAIHFKGLLLLQKVSPQSYSFFLASHPPGNHTHTHTHTPPFSGPSIHAPRYHGANGIEALISARPVALSTSPGGDEANRAPTQHNLSWPRGPEKALPGPQRLISVTISGDDTFLVTEVDSVWAKDRSMIYCPALLRALLGAFDGKATSGPDLFLADKSVASSARSPATRGVQIVDHAPVNTQAVAASWASGGNIRCSS
jgi:hypothetical protein